MNDATEKEDEVIKNLNLIRLSIISEQMESIVPMGSDDGEFIEKVYDLLGHLNGSNAGEDPKEELLITLYDDEIEALRDILSFCDTHSWEYSISERAGNLLDKLEDQLPKQNTATSPKSKYNDD